MDLVVEGECLYQLNKTKHFVQFVVTIKVLLNSRINKLAKDVQVFGLIVSYVLYKVAELSEVELSYVVLVFAHGVKCLFNNNLLLL